MQGYGPQTFGERMAEVYDDWYGTRIADQSTQAAADLLARLAAGGRVLELAIGTGRLALPLAQRGLSVHGIDASEAMVARLRQKPGGDAIPVTIGDFAAVRVPGRFDLVLVAFNSLFNLTSQAEQVRCFQNVAGHLTARGVFVVEAFVPDVAGLDRCGVRAVDITTDSATLEVAVHDRVAQLVEYQYVVMGQEGIRLYPVPQRYAWPSELDLMARLAGLELRERWGGWDGCPFGAASAQHVSVYGRAA
jgi:SAM-dependent methyltransferase